ncbi:MAG: IS1182 family transposase [Pseudomonadota bacterium]
MEKGARVLRPDREQLYWDMIDLDSQIAPDHLARVVWAFVESVDLSPLYDRIKARDDVAGRPTPDPRVLLALWLYATVDGIGSARELERLCRAHVAYRWLCGGVPVNYHGLSDFRTVDGDLLDRILSESVAVLAAEGLIDLDEIAVDGTKVSANAGRGSFRKEKGLERYERAAQRRVERLRAEVENDPGANAARRRAAHERAAREVESRAGAARAKLAALQQEKAEREKTHKKQEKTKGAPRASTTDPQARVMQMPDHGFRPAYNLIVAATTESQVVLALRSTDRRNDTGLAKPMIEEVEARYGRRPARLLVDTKLLAQDEIVALAAHPDAWVEVYTPPPADKPGASPASVRRREAKRRKEPKALQEWRARMASEDGKAVYKRRGRIEAVNASFKNHGLHRFLLRGLDKVRCEALLHGIAHNIRRGVALGCRPWLPWLPAAA